ncbi:class I SAM-dependent methyltransferase [Streptomyces sp. WP-1]|uniref:class I SAM-dependent methyltransferase n=1 Tax=Streptomyces sp. WP-1 TaxID=3041497 RepID=UPI0026496D4B|nr:class I SAM-dependent methyltransferase [Streptomyces sp. WP-1]WKE73689.1 class I SAM-dependent methyltransferase [Streptomyces sp. WP-1]
MLHETRTPEYWDSLYSASYRVAPSRAEERQMMRALTGAECGMRVLDVGCGTGELSARMADWGMRVTGLDFSLAAITSARDTHPDREGLLDFCLYDVTAARPLVPAPEPADLVTCRLSFEFVDSPRFMVHLGRWLKPGGVLYIATHIAEKVSRGVANRGISAARVAELGDTWKHMTVYRLPDNLLGIVLRG